MRTKDLTEIIDESVAFKIKCFRFSILYKPFFRSFFNFLDHHKQPFPINFFAHGNYFAKSMSFILPFFFKKKKTENRKIVPE
jgi:hypothetical protein